MQIKMECGVQTRILINAGRFTARLAQNEADVAAVQALRYRVFITEMGATPTAESAALEREIDAFDAYCDHLMLIDNDRLAAGESLSASTIGVYRLLTRARARDAGCGFYSAGEYDLSALEVLTEETLELGRSCVDANYRGGSAMQLLWMGLSQYVAEYEVKLMFGCASFHGVDLDVLAQPLSHLYHNHLAPEDLRPRALPQHYVSMNLKPKDQVDRLAAMRATPALIKGYLRLGGFVGDGAFIDREFNTVDVAVVMRTKQVADRYKSFYARKSSVDLERLLG